MDVVLSMTRSGAVMVTDGGVGSVASPRPVVATALVVRTTPFWLAALSATRTCNSTTTLLSGLATLSPGLVTVPKAKVTTGPPVMVTGAEADPKNETSRALPTT